MAKADHDICRRDVDRLLTQVEKLQEALKQCQEIAQQALTLTIERALVIDGTPEP